MRLTTILVLLLACSCSTASDPQPATSSTAQRASEVTIKNLCQHWLRSYEEEREAERVEIYRLEGSREFPPKRFRMAYIFHPDGSCEWYYLSPDDAHRFKPGKWKLTGANEELLEIQKDDAKETYRVLELTADVLRLAPLPDSSKGK